MSLTESARTENQEPSELAAACSGPITALRLTRPSLDQIIAVSIAVPVGFLLLILLPIVLVFQGRPFLFGSHRVGKHGQTFTMWKIRTMHISKGPETVMGPGTRALVTPIGAWLRRSRLDELPQILNLIRGEMVFIGPRPQLPMHAYVASRNQDVTLRSPPGLTGLATVTVCGLEEAWLASETTADDVERRYRSICLPRKQRLDQFYCAHSSPVLALYVLGLTVFRGSRSQCLMRTLRRRAGRLSTFISTSLLRRQLRASNPSQKDCDP